MTDASAPTDYRVLARKYRPSDFAGLIGQEALVRTLTNALAGGRLAHAFILTGVRGIGKTTTARIIARALNCVGADGQGGPTAEPCGVCEHCIAIAEDRHMDVLEMDAASRTGVDDIRELIDGVRYAPTSARYKVYIIDEVHMLSRNAFNALLKTLEEPPPHVIFVFATTEVRKVPLTVLSRCQRFDLRRVDAETLVAHLAGIAETEQVQVEPGALALIARAAEGSVRDALSLLDQAMAHGAGAVDEARVRDMLGFADRARVLDLFDAVMAGEIPRALDDLGNQYIGGADPVAVLQDMLELCHWLTRLKVTPGAGDDLTQSEEARTRGREMAEKLSLPVLARTWQMLLRGLDEVRRAHAPLAAAEMVLVRLAYAADLPSPGDLVRRLSDSPETAATPAAPRKSTPAPAPGLRAVQGSTPEPAPEPVPEVEPPPAPTSEPMARLDDFGAVVAQAAERREGILHAQLVNNVHLVKFEPGHIEFRPAAGARESLANDLSEMLAQWTGERWMVSVSSEPGAPTLGEQAAERAAKRQAEAEADPLVQAVIDAFPGAEVGAVRDIELDEDSQAAEDIPEEDT
jgi:DNA polymerase-3 subunit gamma/tau